MLKEFKVFGDMPTNELLAVHELIRSALAHDGSKGSVWVEIGGGREVGFIVDAS